MKKPCKECPFLKTAAKGWLGPHTGKPQEFADLSEYNILPCHSATNYDELEKAIGPVRFNEVSAKTPCIGSMQMAANSCSLPRGTRYPGPYQEVFEEHSKPNEDVFKWKHDFVQYHTI